MTAFLFIPGTTGASLTRRVDLTRFASLFADIDEPLAAPVRGPLLARFLAMLLVLVFAIGDTVLVARPYALTHAPAGPAAADIAPVTIL